MAENHVLLETIQLTQNAASVTLDNIPQTGYTDLKVVASLRGTSAFATMQLYMTFNGVTTGYSGNQLYGDGASPAAAALNNSGAAISIVNINTTQSTSNTFSTTEIYIPNYLSTDNKSVGSESITENNSASALVGINSGTWANSSAITSITFTNQSADNFLIGSTFSLYGIARVGTTPTVAPLATGGNIVSTDGTYWYHTFLTSGTFTPQTELSDVDYLVVAGGGAGGACDAQNYGGGGGAGGLRCTVGATGGGGSLESRLSLLAGTNYPVAIGAGGSSIASAWTNGSNSQFSTIVSTGGGAGGGLKSPPAWVQSLSGGSGGGGDEAFTAGAAGTANQGYAGGTANSVAASSGNQGAGGGGGGAGAVGSNGVSSTGGAGGAGVSTSISGTSVTYAGGGGGAGGSAGGAGGSGGGGAGSSTTATAGTANTGGGGGSGNRSGANGGSGIVVIRYAMA